jgi:hypothetical protein
VVASLLREGGSDALKIRLDLIICSFALAVSAACTEESLPRKGRELDALLTDYFERHQGPVDAGANVKVSYGVDISSQVVQRREPHPPNFNPPPLEPLGGRPPIIAAAEPELPALRTRLFSFPKRHLSFRGPEDWTAEERGDSMHATIRVGYKVKPWAAITLLVDREHRAEPIADSYPLRTHCHRSTVGGQPAVTCNSPTGLTFSAAINTPDGFRINLRGPLSEGGNGRVYRELESSFTWLD